MADPDVTNPLVAFRYSDQFKGWMITGKVSALLSMIGSGYIIYDLMRNRKKRSQMPNRIMLGLSMSDFLWSFVSPFLGTWLVPSGLVIGSTGNQATSTTQGFFAQLFGFWSGTYNAALAICYLLVVRYQMSNDRLRKNEYVLHSLLLGIGLATAIPPLAYNAYNYNGWWLCHTAASPLGCDAPGSTVECERGANAKTLHTWLWNAPHGFLFCVVLIAMVQLYWTVLQQERAGDRYQYGGNMNRTQSKKVAMQGILYVGAYFITWVFYYVIFFMELAGKIPPMWLLGAVAFFVPLQGFFNSIVYLRPRVMRKLRGETGGRTSLIWTSTKGSRKSLRLSLGFSRQSTAGNASSAPTSSSRDLSRFGRTPQASDDENGGRDTSSGDLEGGITE